MKAQSVFISLFLFSLFCGCTQKNPLSPTVGKAYVSEVVSTPKSAPMASAQASVETTQAISAEITFQKSEIFNRSFLYGSDLQYSSVGEADVDVTLQAVALGHVPAYFRLIGSRLQLLQDQRSQFASDINHPEKLIHEFQVIRQNDTTVTVVAERASSTLITTLLGADSPLGQPKQSWVRSAEFVPSANLLLIESSVEAPNGQVAEFMESLFPREALVPSDYKFLLASPEYEPLAKRFRFIGNDAVFMSLPEHGRVKVELAQRFYLANAKVVEWYVTPNIPLEYLNDLKNGIEGWNRYSQAMWKRDLVSFKGLLPPGVKLGDPRYNVVNWDSVAEAGAAYASSAADPLTGIQSHSLIYVPYAWINIGKTYWERGRFSESEQIAATAVKRYAASRTYFGRSLKLNCVQDPTTKITLDSRNDTEAFARGLLKAVVLHEVGHSLGLHHNFKASLVYDPDNEHSRFSTSIMDYNQFHIEKAFDSLDSASGPLLEYDRQAISALYNDGKDIASTDNVLPACNDEESDSTDDGVDALCIRYDAGFDPTLYLQRMLDLISKPDAKLGKTQSLSVALSKLREELSDPQTLTSKEALNGEISKLQSSILGTVNFYLASSASSIAYMGEVNTRLLRMFKEDSLPSVYNEGELRSRAFSNLQQIAQLDRLPPASLNELNLLIDHAKSWAERSAYLVSLPQPSRDQELSSLLSPLTQLLPSDPLAKARARALGALTHIEGAPFEFASDGKDYEQLSLQVLEGLVLSKSGDKARSQAERLAYVKALRSFKSTSHGALAFERVAKGLEAEILLATNARERAELRGLLKELRTEASKTEASVL